MVEKKASRVCTKDKNMTNSFCWKWMFGGDNPSIILNSSFMIINKLCCFMLFQSSNGTKTPCQCFIGWIRQTNFLKCPPHFCDHHNSPNPTKLGQKGAQAGRIAKWRDPKGFQAQTRRHGADHLALPPELCYPAPAEWKTTFLLLCCYRLVPIVAGRCYVRIIQKLQQPNPLMPQCPPPARNEGFLPTVVHLNWQAI